MAKLDPILSIENPSIAQALDFARLRNPESLQGRMASGIIADLLGANQGSPDEQERERLRDICRIGNPFPLIAYLWPDLLVTDPEEARHFEGAIGDTSNPCLRLDSWQRQILLSLVDESIAELAIKGCTKAGKGTSISIGVCLWVYTYSRAKVILTSQRYEHAKDVIFAEIAHWWSRMSDQSVAALQSSGIVSKDRTVTIVNPQTGEGFSGQHGPRVLFVLDEASSVPDGRFDDARKQARKLVAIANPRTIAGAFHSMFPKDDPNRTQTISTPAGRRLCLTVGGEHCLNVRAGRIERPIAPHGGITIRDRRYEEGEKIDPADYELVKPLIPNQIDSARYRAILAHPDKCHVSVFGHGHFPDEDAELQLILGSWLDRHEAAHPPAGPPEAFSLDVARSLDGDMTCLAAGNLLGCHKLYLAQYADTTKTVAWVIETAILHYGIDLRRGRNPITIDMDGLGSGVGDRLRELGCWVIEFRGNASSEVDPKRYCNLRTEAYAELGARLNPMGKRPEPWAIPFDPLLREELAAHDKRYARNDRLRFGVRPKDGTRDDPGIKQLIGRSPDRSDAVAYLWHSLRVFHVLDEIIRSYEGDVIAWPRPPKPDETGMRDEEKVRLKQEQEAARSNDLLAWAKARYGNRGWDDI